MRRHELTPEIVLAGYAQGVFPMAHPEEQNEIYWYAPDPRAVLPLDGFHIPRNLARLMRRQVFDVTADRAFRDVIRACADRPETWISPEIIEVYSALHDRGFAHSIEVWRNQDLVGGLYGVAIGGAYFGESMFHRVTDSSKVALVHLVERLLSGGFTLLDTQFSTAHLQRFGVIEISRVMYERRLLDALSAPAVW